MATRTASVFISHSARELDHSVTRPLAAGLRDVHWTEECNLLARERIKAKNNPFL